MKSTQTSTRARVIRDRSAHQSHLVQQNRQLEQQLAERAAEAEHLVILLRMLATELTQAEQRERRRLAHILHDHLQQLLVAAKIKLKTMEKHLELGEIEARVKGTYDLIDEAIRESRSLAVELNPPILFEEGFVAALHWFARDVQKKHGLKLDIQINLVLSLSDEMRILLFQIVRELVLNAIKHAGVDTVCVWARHEDNRIVLGVEDGGRGFDTARLDGCEAHESFGLFSIRERLKLLLGGMEIDSRPGEGTRVRVEIPLEGGALSSAGAKPKRMKSKFRSTARAARPKSKRIRVLFVDDQRIFPVGSEGLLDAQPEIQDSGESLEGAMTL